MSLIAWNCHGLGKPRTVRFLKEIAQQQKPSFIFLSETLTNKNKVEKICKEIGFAGCMAVNARGHSGGLALLWKMEGGCVVTEVSNHFIDSKSRMIKLVGGDTLASMDAQKDTDIVSHGN